MLHSGKHKGHRFVDVAQEDRSYCAWVLRDGGPSFSSFAAYLRRQHGGVMVVGKHKGQFYDEIVLHDAEYCAWAVSVIDPGPALHEFIEYVNAQALDPLPTIGGEQQDGGREGTPARKRRCCTAGPCQCNICFAMAAGRACIPCGHVLCGICASKLCVGCPFCRATIDRCVKLFLQ